jgi:nucleotide-binding universal stress UspA family protein
VVIVAVIVSGAFIGINNTLTTQAVMLVSPVERPVASSAYGFLRFIGGGLAPYVAGKLADATDLSVPFYLGAATFVLAVPVLASGHGLLRRAETDTGESEPMAPSLTPVGAPAATDTPPVIVAVGAHDRAAAIVDAAARLARDTGSPLEVVHVQQTAVVEEQAVETETTEQARAAVVAHLDRLAGQGIAATGQILGSVGDHAAAGRALAQHAARVGARAVAVGRSPRGPLAQFADGSLTTALTHSAPCTVVLLDAGDSHRHLTPDTLAELRDAAA